jgi:pimeloyl-ACP methyl ester carboxylesterase
MTTGVREGTVKANGLEFAYLEQGSGPLLLLLHGFPDNAYTWSHQMPVFADAGYRTVAPFMRGYPPTQIPDGGFFDSATLALDARDLIEGLGGGDPAYVLGTDWGTFMTLALMQAFPETVRRAVVTAVPHQPAAAGILGMGDLLRHTWHAFFNTVPHLPEVAYAADDFALVEYLWETWEPGFHDPDHLASIKRTLSEPGALTAALNYYRAQFAFDPARIDPAIEDVRQRLTGMISVPTMVVFGREDPYARFGENHRAFFTGGFRLEILDGGRHFIHRSRPDVFNPVILSWLDS